MIRPATKEDAPVIAKLGNIAGEGLPKYLWSQEAGPEETPLAVGIQRAKREEGDFSYRNASIYEAAGVAAGVLIGRQLDDPYTLPDFSALPEQVHPLIELESHAPGSWYINVLAVDAAFRRRGIATVLIAEAERQAHACGAASMSLIVDSTNDGAIALYKKCGYRPGERRPMVSFPGATHDGDWILMRKVLA